MYDLFWCCILILFVGVVHTENITEGISSTSTVVHVDRDCDLRSNCSNNQLCFNGRCECMPNYFVNYKGVCVKQNCLLNRALCNVGDPNQFCDIFPVFEIGHCICKDNYIQDHETGVCRPKCTPLKTDMCKLIDDENSICNVYRCQCRSNYHRDPDTGKCVPFQCKVDSNCWSEGEYHRTCQNGTCVCNYDINPENERCIMQLTGIFKIRYYYSWHGERILLATMIIVPIVFYYCVLQNYRKAKLTLATFNVNRVETGEQFSVNTIESLTEKKCQYYGGMQQAANIILSTDMGKGAKCGTGIKYQRFE